jgi:hypothetical protein
MSIFLLSLFSKLPQPGGPGSCIYFYQEQGSPVISPGIGFPLPQLESKSKSKSKSKSHYDRQSVCQSVLVSGAHLGPTTNFSISLRFSCRQLLFVML